MPNVIQLGRGRAGIQSHGIKLQSLGVLLTVMLTPSGVSDDGPNINGVIPCRHLVLSHKVLIGYFWSVAKEQMDVVYMFYTYCKTK